MRLGERIHEFIKATILEKYAEVQTVIGTARALGCSRSTVKKYLYESSSPRDVGTPPPPA